MKPSYVIASIFFVTFALSPVIAQQSPRLLFEVTVNGAVVARPEMKVPSDGEGRLELDRDHGVERVDFKPTTRGDQAMAIAFTVTSGDRQFHPTLVITRTVPGTIEWTSSTGTETFRLGVSWVE